MQKENVKSERMRNDSLKYYNKDFVFTIISILLVFVLAIYHFDESNSIKLFPDEIGFWQNAALLTGRDWSGTGSQISYYGFGFGFLLAPIMMLFQSSVAKMHAAIFLQAGLLSSCVIAIRFILHEINNNIGKWEIRILSTLPVLYSAYLFMTKVTLAEILLLTCFCWWLYAIIAYIKRNKYISGFFVAIIPVYMYAVHQRTMPFIFLSALIILIDYFCHYKKKRDVKSFVVLFSLLLIILFSYIFTKQYENFYILKIYGSASEDSNVARNTVAGQVGSKAALFFSLEGLISLFQSFCGKLYYSIVATFGLVGLGLISGFLSIKSLILRESKNQIKDIFSAVVLICFLTTIAVSTIATVGDYKNRFDILLYGRYSEFTFGSMILIGGMMLFDNSSTFSLIKNSIFINIAIIMILTIVCINLTYDDASISVFWISCSGLGDLRNLVINHGFSNKDVIFIAGVRSVLVLLLLSFFYRSHKSKYNLLSVWFAIIAVFWIYIADINWTGNVMNWYQDMEMDQVDIIDGIENESIVGYVDADNIGCFQFLLPDTYFENVGFILDSLDQYEGIYIITNSDSNYINKISSQCTIDKQNDSYIRWSIDRRAVLQIYSGIDDCAFLCVDE